MTKLQKNNLDKKPTKYKLYIVVRDKQPGWDIQEGKWMSYDKKVVYRCDKLKKFVDDFLNKSQWKNWIMIDVYDNISKSQERIARFTKDNPPEVNTL